MRLWEPTHLGWHHTNFKDVLSDIFNRYWEKDFDSMLEPHMMLCSLLASFTNHHDFFPEYLEENGYKTFETIPGIPYSRVHTYLKSHPPLYKKVKTGEMLMCILYGEWDDWNLPKKVFFCKKIDTITEKSVSTEVNNILK